MESIVKRVQAGLATEAGAPDPRQRQYTIVVVLATIVVTVAGWMFDLRAAALIAGLTTVFALVAACGQSLRADLRRFAQFVPALVVVMTTGPLLVSVPVLAGLLVAVVVFGAGMLPALGEHYRVLGQTFAAATLIATTTGIGSDQPAGVLFACAASGALLALLLRVLLGLSDPTRAMRAEIARVLTEPGPGVVERAATAWRTDGSTTWMGQVLAGAARFRAARETLLAQAHGADRFEADRLRRIVAEADGVAAALATAVRSRVCTALPQAARADPAELVLRRGGRQDVPDAVRGINEGLDRIRRAVIERDTSSATPPSPGGRRERALGAMRAHLSLRSSLFRHALRCTLAVGGGMVVVLLLRDPSASALILSLYLVLQPAARDSMTGALERTGGVVLGVSVLAAVITVLPGAFLLVPVAIAAMLLRVQLLRTDYRVLLGALIAVTVVAQTMELRTGSLVNAAISFAANTAIGAAIALIVGFVGYLVLPGSLVPDVRGTVRATVWAVSELQRSVRAAGRGADVGTGLQAAHVLALRRTQDLLGMPALLDGTGSETEDQATTRAAAISLDALHQDLATLAFRPVAEQSVAVPALRAVDELLGGNASTTVPDVPSGGAPATELLASSLVENALHARSAIDETFGHNEPWRSYTLSFIRPERLRIR